MTAYVAGTRIETRQGRAGTLAGAANLDRNPYVQFDDGGFAAIPPAEIGRVIDRPGAVHRFDSTGEAYDAAQRLDELQDDVLWVPSEGVAGVLVQTWPVAVNEPDDRRYGEFEGYVGGPDALAAAAGGRYAVGVERARKLLARSAGADVPRRPGQAADPSWPVSIRDGLLPDHGRVAGSTRRVRAAAPRPAPRPGRGAT